MNLLPHSLLLVLFLLSFDSQVDLPLTWIKTSKSRKLVVLKFTLWRKVPSAVSFKHISCKIFLCCCTYSLHKEGWVGGPVSQNLPPFSIFFAARSGTILAVFVRLAIARTDVCDTKACSRQWFCCISLVSSLLRFLCSPKHCLGTKRLSFASVTAVSAEISGEY